MKKFLVLLFLYLICAVPISANTGNDFYPYVKAVNQKIQNNWKLPKPSQLALSYTGDGTVGVIITIDRDGRLLNSKIVDSSGVDVIDDYALKAVEKSQPFKPLPSNWLEDTMSVKILFQYWQIK